MRILYLVLILMLAHVSFAQTIRGKITDRETQRAVPHAIIQLNNGDKVSHSNENGEFRITGLKIARYTLKISCEGYEDAVLFEILVSSGKEAELNVALTEKHTKLREVIIQGQHGSSINDMALVSARSFTVEQTKRYPSSWGDPGRMALFFAGTSSVNDETNEIVIRGNSPKGLLWRIDGVEVPGPNHFSAEGASGGGISAISTSLLSNSDFFTGAFPAEYGNASSGVFDIRLRKGNDTKREHSIQVGIQGVEASAEGPFSKNAKASYLINYRYSTLKILEELGLNIVSTATPNFQDLGFKLFFPFKKSTLSVWGLGALSSSDYKVNPDHVQIEKSDFYASGINLVSLLNPKMFWENIISFSGNRNINSNAGTYFLTKVQNEYYTIRYSSQVNYKLSAVNSLRTGIIYSRLSFDVLNRFQVQSFVNDIVKQSGATQNIQSYAQWKYRPTPWLTVNSGVHFMYFLLNSTYAVEPRIAAGIQLSEKSNLSFGYGKHSRLEPASTYMFNKYDTLTKQIIMPNRQLAIPGAHHFVMGYELTPGRNWRVLTEAYYQKHYKVGVGNSLSDQSISTYSLLNVLDASRPVELVSRGTGENLGLELTVERFLTGGFYLLSTTSLFKSTFKTLDDIKRTARFSNNFVQNILAGKEWKVGKSDHNILGINLRTSWAGGVRVIPIDVLASLNAQSQVLSYENIYNDQQLPGFFRSDLRVSFTKNSHRITSTWSLELNNITNHVNPKGIYFDGTDNSISTVNQLGLIPVLNYRLDF